MRYSPRWKLLHLLQEVGLWIRNGFPVFIKEHPDLDLVGMMLEVLSKKQKYDAYVIMSELFAIALSITVSTSIVESGYSVINAIKNYKSDGLGDVALDDELNILFNGPLEMDICM
jgi:hypothetical protein